MPTETTTAMGPAVDGKDLITITDTYRPGWLGRLLGRREHQSRRQYVGSCTVWYSYPEFARCGTLTESWLADVWTRERFKQAGGLAGKR